MADGDNLSKLIQLQATRHDILLPWTGKGIDDLISVCSSYAIKARIAKHLWTATRELMKMPEMATLPEPLQAKICSIILQAQTLVDLDGEAHSKKLATLDKTKGA